jgi:hypothetical protein
MNGAFDSVGIGIVENGGVIYVVEDFAHRVSDLKDDDAAERVAEQFSKFRQTAGAASLPHGATDDCGRWPAPWHNARPWMAKRH